MTQNNQNNPSNSQAATEQLHPEVIEAYRARTDAIKAAGGSSLVAMSPGDFIASAPPVEWLIEGVLPHWVTTLLHAGPKVGKTTLAMQWLRCFETGEPWLGLDAKQVSVLYLTEEGGTTLGEAIHEMNIDLQGAHRIAPAHAKGYGWDWPTTLAQAMARCEEEGHGLLIIDTLGAWADITDANSYAEMSRLIKTVRAMANVHQIAVLIVHHSRKAAGNTTNAASGSNAATGGPDHILYLRETGKDRAARTISADTRFREALPALTFRRNGPGDYVRAAADAGPYPALFDAAFPNVGDALTNREIADRLNVEIKTAQRIAADAVGRGVAEKQGHTITRIA